MSAVEETIAKHGWSVKVERNAEGLAQPLQAEIVDERGEVVEVATGGRIAEVLYGLDCELARRGAAYHIVQRDLPKEDS